MLSVFVASTLTKEVLTLIFFWFMDMLVIEMLLLLLFYYINAFMYIPLGDGKTHYIKKRLHQPYLVIAVNESFNPLNAVVKLRSLPRNESCNIFFNFTIVPTIVSSSASHYILLYSLISSASYKY